MPLSPLHKGTIVSAPSPSLLEVLHVTCLCVVLGNHQRRSLTFFCLCPGIHSQSHPLQIGHKTGSTLSVIGWCSGQGSGSPLTRAFRRVQNRYWPLSLPASALTVQALIFGDGRPMEVACQLTAQSPLSAHSLCMSPARGSSQQLCVQSLVCAPESSPSFGLRSH